MFFYSKNKPVFMLRELYIFRLVALLSMAIIGCYGCSDRNTNPLYDAARKAFIEDKKNYEPIQGRIFDLLNNNEYQTVEDLIASIEEKYAAGKSSEFYYFLSYRALDTSRHGLLPKINEWIKAFPDSDTAYYARGSYYVTKALDARGGKYISETPAESIEAMTDYFSLAAIDLGKSLELNPNLQPAIIRLMLAAKYLGNKELIEYLYRIAINVNPNSYYAPYTYAESLVPKWGVPYKRLREFVKSKRVDYELNPRLYALEGIEYATKGQTLYVSKKYTQAISEYKRALEYAPLIDWNTGVARSYRKLGDKRSEIEYLNEALYYWPTAAYSMSKRASVYAELGEDKKASADVDQAMRLVLGVASRPYTYRKCGWVYEKLGEHKKAAAAYEKSIDGDPDNSYALRRAGRIYSIYLNESERAIPLLERLTELKPDDPRSWLYFGDALEDLDDERAIESLRKYLSLVDHNDESQKRIITQVKRYLETGEKP